MRFADDIGLSSGEFYTRVCDKVEVYHFETDVIVDDLSEEWKNSD